MIPSLAGILRRTLQSKLSYVTFQGNIEIEVVAKYRLSYIWNVMWMKIKIKVTKAGRTAYVKIKI